MFRLVLLVMSGLMLAGCGGYSSSDVSSQYATALASSAAASEASSMDAVAQETMLQAQKVVGMSEEQAISTLQESSNGSITTRVVSRDGQDYPVTMDYSPSRVNLWIENGTVTNASVG